MKRLALGLLLRAVLLLPTPPRQPMVQCDACNSMNEPHRTTCRNCGAVL